MKNNWLIIYSILLKQYFIKFKSWIIFLVVCAGVMGIAGHINSKAPEYQGILVGVCAEDEMGSRLLDKLQSQKGVFRFQGYSNQEEMIREIENGTLECGYLLPEGFYENILAGKTTRQITLYSSPVSSAHKISYEVVFADLFEILSGDILQEYLREKGYQGEELEKAEDELLALNTRYAGDESTFHFVFETTDGERDVKPENLNSLRGCISVMIFFMSLLGLGNSIEQSNTWKAFPQRAGRRLKSGSIHVAVCGSILLGGICLWLAGSFTNPLKEIMGLLVYFIILEIYIRVLSLFFKSSRVLYGVLPIMLLGSFLFAPVFIRLDRYIPYAGWIKGLFPATYYLNFFFT